jgi:hypothetical protein
VPRVCSGRRLRAPGGARVGGGVKIQTRMTVVEVGRSGSGHFVELEWNGNTGDCIQLAVTEEQARALGRMIYGDRSVTIDIGEEPEGSTR